MKKLKKIVWRKGWIIGCIITVFCLVLVPTIKPFQTTVLLKTTQEVGQKRIISTYGEQYELLENIENKEINPGVLITILLEQWADRLENEELFETLITELMRLAHISALSAAIIKDNECAWSKGFGLYDRENNKTATEETIYLVASISKTFTATALMQLYETGRFALDDDVNVYLPFNFRNPHYPDEPITFRMLLAHQSSLAKDPPAVSYVYLPGDLEVTGYPYPFLQDYFVPGSIHYKPQIWTTMPPGTEMRYANMGYALSGYLVETLSGKSFEDYCRENIFDPLGMNDTSFRFANVDPAKVAVPYVVEFGTYHPLLHYSILRSPAGGLRTSVSDLSRFLIAHMNGGLYNDVRILKEETIDTMHTVQYISKTYNFQYGLGWQIWKTFTGTHVGHTGGLAGVATKMVFRQSDNTGIIFFTNKEISNSMDMVIFSLIEQLLFWKASGFNAAELHETIIEDTTTNNMHLLTERYTLL